MDEEEQDEDEVDDDGKQIKEEGKGGERELDEEEVEKK